MAETQSIEAELFAKQFLYDSTNQRTDTYGGLIEARGGGGMQIGIPQATDAVRKAQVPRLLVVGGCGSLWYAPGLKVVNSHHWPLALKTSGMTGHTQVRRC